MSTNIYKRLSWGPSETLSTDKLNDMVGNSDYLFNTSINGYYNVLGVTRDSGLSIRCGYIKAPNTANNYQALGLYYNRPFLPGVRPVVVIGLALTSRADIDWGVKGLDGQAIPDNRGFTLHLWHSDGSVGDVFTGDQNFSYIAIAPSG